MKHFLGQRLYTYQEVGDLTGFSRVKIRDMANADESYTREVGKLRYLTDYGVRTIFDLDDSEFKGFLSLAEKRDAKLGRRK